MALIAVTQKLRTDRGIISVIEGGASDAYVPGNRRDIEASPVSEPSGLPELTSQSFQVALSLIECAAKALEILYDKRDQLEASLEDVSARAEDAVVMAQSRVSDWQKLAAGLKTEVQNLERQVNGLQRRAELAEAQVEAERSRADTAERGAAEAFGLSRGLHARIMSAFGGGTRAHKALASVSTEALDSRPDR